MSKMGKYRNMPCLCGSGRKLKHCCLKEIMMGEVVQQNEVKKLIARNEADRTIIYE